MRKLALMVAVGIAVGADGAQAQGTQYHQGYNRQDGTYVQPHYQTAPNNNAYDNWSTRGNTNPYTGQPGYQTPNPYGPRARGW